MSQFIAMAIPVLPGKTETWKDFMKDLSTTYKKEFSQSRKSLKVRERVFFQSTPHGDVVIVTLEGDNPEQAFAHFGVGDSAFTRWFVDRVREVHGLDLTKPPNGAMPKMVADSQ